MRGYCQEYDSFCQSLKIDESSLEKGIPFDDYDATHPCLIVIVESSQAGLAPSHLYVTASQKHLTSTRFIYFWIMCLEYTSVT